MRSYFLFIKIGEETHIDSLQKKGHIYCNTIRYFRKIEDDGIRGDENEGKAYLQQTKNLILTIEDKKIGYAQSAQFYADNPKDIGNIFCLYGLETKDISFKNSNVQKVQIENDSKSFGKYALLILDPKEFIERIKGKLSDMNKEFNFHPVNYYDDKTYNGELSPFYKSKKYKNQKEIRLWVPNNNEEPFEFYIGDISDISHKIKASDLDKITVEKLN